MLLLSLLCCLLMCYSLAAYRNLGNYLWLSALVTTNLLLGSPLLLVLSLTAFFLSHYVNLSTSVPVVVLSKLLMSAILSCSTGGALLALIFVWTVSFTFKLDTALAYLTLGGLYILLCSFNFFIFSFFIVVLYRQLATLCTYSLIMGIPLSILFFLKFNLIAYVSTFTIVSLLIPVAMWGSKFLLFEVTNRGRGVLFILGGLLVGSHKMIWIIVVFSCCIYFSVCLLVHGVRTWLILLVGGLPLIHCGHVQFFGVNQLVLMHFRLGAYGRVLFLFNRHFFFSSPGHFFLFIGALH